MPVKKAEVRVADVILQVLCPGCGTEQPSPNYAPSTGWDKSDLKRVGKGERAVVCERCRTRFGLPARAFSLAEGQA